MGVASKASSLHPYFAPSRSPICAYRVGYLPYTYYVYPSTLGFLRDIAANTPASSVAHPLSSAALRIHALGVPDPAARLFAKRGT
jgi:hypothetical protein